MVGLYVVKDIVAAQFGPPMAARTEMAASRQFILMFKDPNISQTDYELYSVGTFDEDTGEMKVHSPVKITPVYKKNASLEEVL